MKKDFLAYIQNEFTFSPEEMVDFEKSLSTPLKKSIRINTNKISVSDFKKHAQKKGWVLSETGYGKNLFYIDRTLDLHIPLGNTLEHTSGYFYIQEVAASSSPFYLSKDIVSKDEFIILDMSASPGGKTTSLSEYYPNSIIIANELDKKRLKSLHENIDRMGGENVVVTNYDGRFFRNYENTFDRILLDAPCSGEGTSFKTEDALKFWNIKNIKHIAKLQLGLLESALIALKVGGEMVYSTCTLNTLENEEVIYKIIEKFGDKIEIMPISKENQFKKNWPHINNTGGFFVAVIKKIDSIPNEKQKNIQDVKQNLKRVPNKIEKHIVDFVERELGGDISKKYLWIYEEHIFMTNQSLQYLDDLFFFFKIGIHIGDMVGGQFEPNFFLGILLRKSKNGLHIQEDDFHTLMQGYELDVQEGDGYYLLTCDNLSAGIGKVKNNKLKSLIPTKFLRG